MPDLVDPFFIGAEDNQRALARDGVALAGQFRDVPGMDDIGRGEAQFDGGVDRDDQFVVGEGFVGVVVSPEPLPAGCFDLQRFACATWRPAAPVAGISRAFSV